MRCTSQQSQIETVPLVSSISGNCAAAPSSGYEKRNARQLQLVHGYVACPAANTSVIGTAQRNKTARDVCAGGVSFGIYFHKSEATDGPVRHGRHDFG